MFFIIAIVAGAGFFTFIKKIKFFGLLSLLLGALFLYNVIEVSRQADDRGLEAIVEALSSTNNEKSNFIEESSFSNTTVTARAAFALVPDEYDFFYGKFKLIGLAGIIPFSRSLFVAEDDRYTTSSNVLTEGVMGSWATWSLGTNIISDIYIDFGILGVVLLMLLMGYFANFVQEMTIRNIGSVKWTVIYLVVLALYSEVPRYSFDFPVRNIFWTFLLFWIYDMLIKNPSSRITV